MCIVFLAYDCHPEYSLILAANRDEFYVRPSQQAHFWSDWPNVLAGRDLEQYGTWLGVTIQGRFGALTNYRDPSNIQANAKSRGHLVSRFLTGTQSPETYLYDVNQQADCYNGFNLLTGVFGKTMELWYYSNRNGQSQRIKPGIHGLSNHLLNTPWPKVQQGRLRFDEIIHGTGLLSDRLWQLLGDTTEPPIDQLPRTGVSLEWERLLAPIQIDSPTYGTRAATLLFIGRGGEVRFFERSRNIVTREWITAEFCFTITG